MTIYHYAHTMRSQFSRLLVDYFTELDSDIPEEIIRGKLTDLIQSENDSGILHVDLVFAGETAIGFSIYQIDTPKSDWCKRPGWGFIREFYICPAFRERGIGRKLAAHSEKRLRELGAAQLYLTADNGIPFWLRCGWKQTPEICSNDLPILEKT